MKPEFQTIAVSVWLALSAPALATQYTFTLIVDNQSGQFAGMELSAPSINDPGHVLFTTYDADIDEDFHYCRKTGNAYVELFSFGPTGDYPNLIGQAYLGNSGKVLASLTSQTGINATIFNPTAQSLYGNISAANGISDVDAISFTTMPNSAVHRGNGGMPTTVFTYGGSYVSRPNNAGQIAIGGTISQVPTQIVGVRRADGVNPEMTLADSTGPLSQIMGIPDINEAGTVVFGVTLDGGGTAIWTRESGPITTVVDSFGPFSIFPTYDINNAGTVAFFGFRDLGDPGIFTGPDPVTDKVIEPGDTLDGTVVQAVGFERGGLNNAGQIAFLAYFGDLSHYALYIATPVGGCGPPDGDMNVDAARNGRDIRSFVAAVLVDSTAQADLCHADFSGNSVIDAGDVPGFVAAILAG